MTDKYILTESDVKDYKKLIKQMESFEAKHGHMTSIDISIDSLSNKIKLGGLFSKFGFTFHGMRNPWYSSGIITDSSEEYSVESFINYTRDNPLSWSDDGRQPDGWYYKISFPTGKFFLCKDCPQSLFDEMFSEIKGYGPKYSDTANKVLLFDHTNAVNIHNEIHNIISKYKQRAVELTKQDKIEMLEKQLAELKNEE